jgi:hypothetical protein
MRIATSVLLLLLVLVPAAGSAQELVNDGFDPGDTATYSAGFVAGEIVASRFTPAGPGQLTRVTLLFGGAAGTGATVTLHVWDDTGGLMPGADLHTSDFALASDDAAFQELDLSGAGIFVSGPFRVGIELQANGPPSVAHDDDGTVSAADNFIYASTGTWSRSETVGIAGDWILRATVLPEPDAGVALDAGSEADVGAGLDAGALDAAVAMDASTPESRSNADCELGQYCGATGVCSFDCREDSDCAGGTTCNSLGRCVAAAPASSCGCRAGARGPGGLGLGLVSLAVLVLRRRAGR